MARLLGYGIVYFVAEAGNKENSPCKVGSTIKAESRLINLQMSSAYEYVYADMIFVKTWYDYVEQLEDERYADRMDEDAQFDLRGRVIPKILPSGALEAELHALYREQGLHIRGEWFSGGYKKLVAIAKEHLAKNHAGKDYLSFKSFRRKILLMEEEAGLKLAKTPNMGKYRKNALSDMFRFM